MHSLLFKHYPLQTQLTLNNPIETLINIERPISRSMKASIGAGMAENDTITMRLKIDSRGRIQIREEDRTFLGLVGGELMEVTMKRAKIPGTGKEEK